MDLYDIFNHHIWTNIINEISLINDLLEFRTISKNSSQIIPFVPKFSDRIDESNDFQKEMMAFIWKENKYVVNYDSFVTFAIKHNKTCYVHKYMKKCNINTYFPMDYAIYYNNLDILNIIIKHGGICRKDSVNIASSLGYVEIVKWLSNNTNLQFSKMAMNNAARHGHFDVLIWLHENRQEGCNSIALVWAALNGHFDVVKWLFNYRIEVQQHVYWAMDWAALKNHKNIVLWLNENKRDLNANVTSSWYAKNCHLKVFKTKDVNIFYKTFIKFINHFHRGKVYIE